MSQRILVTGAGGYIGTTLVPTLIAAGHSIVAVDTFWFGDYLPTAPNLIDRLYRDVRDLTPADFKDITVVIDLAALSNDPCGESFTEATRDINHVARVRTAGLARAAGVRHYILASSCSVYGFHSDERTEQSCATPLTEYARANLAAERDTLTLAREGFSVTIMRLSTLFGASPRMRLDLVVNSMCYSAWRHGEITISGAGTQMRPLLHVSDVAQAVIRLIDRRSGSNNGLLLNIGSNNMNLCINEIAEQIREHFGNLHNRNISLRHCGPQDLRSYKVNFSLLAEALSWSPRLAIKNAVDEIVNYIKYASEEDIARCHTLDWYQRMGGATALMPPAQQPPTGTLSDKRP